jgi:negative regulator of flagellin synthesis FlgM
MEIPGVIQALKNFEKSQAARSDSEGAKDSGKSKSSTSDTVKFSSTAKLYSRTMREVRESPEARQQKIDQIKQLVESGQYKPDLKKTAENLIKQDLHLII